MQLLTKNKTCKSLSLLNVTPLFLRMTCPNCKLSPQPWGRYCIWSPLSLFFIPPFHSFFTLYSPLSLFLFPPFHSFLSFPPFLSSPFFLPFSLFVVFLWKKIWPLYTADSNSGPTSADRSFLTKIRIDRYKNTNMRIFPVKKKRAGVGLTLHTRTRRSGHQSSCRKRWSKEYLRAAAALRVRSDPPTP